MRPLVHFPVDTSDHDSAFEAAFDSDGLKEAAEQLLNGSKALGIDRVTAVSFRRRLSAEVAIVERKGKDGTYRFTPYREKLLSKGPGHPPRVISIPTMRDRLVLQAMNRLLQIFFPKCVNRRLPNTFVRSTTESIAKAPPNSRYGRFDIEAFYPSIRHDLLHAFLAKHVRCPRLLRLIRCAIRTPTVRQGARRTTQLPSKGVPQGLAVSNILAEIYLGDFDADVAQQTIGYERYVDDAFVLTAHDQEAALLDVISSGLAKLGLRINREKSCGMERMCELDVPFAFLGYTITRERVSVRESNYQAFADSLAALFASYRSGHYGGKYLDRTRGGQAFVEDVNERITGAISDKRRYGWLFYFAEMSDLTTLARLNLLVASLFERLPGYAGSPVCGLKSFLRAYHEIRHSPDSGYVHNYNRYVATTEKLGYLRLRGFVDVSKPDSTYAEADIKDLFERVRRKNLTRLERDVGLLS